MDVLKQLELWRSRDPENHSYTISMEEGVGFVTLEADYFEKGAIEARCYWKPTINGLEEAVLNCLGHAVKEETAYIARAKEALNKRTFAVLGQCFEVLTDGQPKKVDYPSNPAKLLGTGR